MNGESVPRVQSTQQQQQKRKSSLFTIDSILENKKEEKMAIGTNLSSSSSSSPTTTSSSSSASNLKLNLPKVPSLNINMFQPYHHLQPQLNDTHSVFNQFFHAASSKSTI